MFVAPSQVLNEPGWRDMRYEPQLAPGLRPSIEVSGRLPGLSRPLFSHNLQTWEFAEYLQK